MIRETQVKDFLNTGFRSFSTYDCVINIPSMIDGLKVSQRKVLHTMLARNKKMKVEQFANDASGYTHYHHGSGNLEGVIVGLAQDFTGSNNVNFLTPNGQFGNILSSAAASARYIFVEPNPNFRKWFKKEDDCILKYEYEDGDQIEPTYFIPVVPTLLFNGSSGIGTGYACKILSYNPKAIAENVALALAGKKLKKMIPWIRGYTGKVTKDDTQTIYTGTFERVNSTTVKITALPIGYDLESYKNELAKLIDKEDIKDYDDHSTDEKWEIMVYAPRAFLSQSDDVLTEKLKLITRDSENITVWNEHKKIQCFDSPEALIEHFAKWRLGVYEERRLKQIEILNSDLAWAEEKIRFIKFYIKNAKWFSESKKVDIVQKMQDQKFTRVDDLLSIRVYNLTLESIQKLEDEIEELKLAISKLQSTTAKDIYMKELKDSIT